VSINEKKSDDGANGTSLSRRREYSMRTYVLIAVAVVNLVAASS
jgi:hypothetical protein